MLSSEPSIQLSTPSHIILSGIHSLVYLHVNCSLPHVFTARKKLINRYEPMGGPIIYNITMAKRV